MKIDMVTPKRAYLVLSPDGSEVARFNPGDIMQVSRIRNTDEGEILSVSCRDIEFGIPTKDVYVMSELSLV